MPPARLITVALSHFCEKARWALDWTRVPYCEEDHLPVFHFLATLLTAASTTVPVLRLPDRVLRDSTDILLYADAKAAAADRLLPLEPSARRECLQLEALCDVELGPATRLLAYHHLLPQPQLCLPTIQTSGPRWQQRLVRPLFPLIRAAMRWRMQIHEAGAQAARRAIAQVFSVVAQRLADGRPYLLGEQFSAADLTFAALAAPLVQPAQYGFPLLALESQTAELQALTYAYRGTPAGAFALRIYEQHRRPGLARSQS